MELFIRRERKQLNLGRLFGFPIHIDFSLILLLGLLALLGGNSFGITGLILAVFLFGSVLLHELGHSLVARRLGIPISGITLYPFGGMARMTRMPDSPKDEILISAAGPVTSILAFLFFSFISWLVMAGSPMAFGAGYLAKVNLVLGLFNLAPALPMDGGRILRAILSIRHGFIKGTVIASKVATYLGFAMIGVALFMGNFWMVFIAAIVLILARKEVAMTRLAGYRAGYGNTWSNGSREPFEASQSQRQWQGQSYSDPNYSNRGESGPFAGSWFWQWVSGSHNESSNWQSSANTSNMRGSATVSECEQRDHSNPHAGKYGGSSPASATASTSASASGADSVYNSGDSSRNAPGQSTTNDGPSGNARNKPYTILHNPDGSIILNVTE